MKRVGNQLNTSAVISQNVKRLRLARGWTQEEAGRRLGELTGSPWSGAVWSTAEKQTRHRVWTAEEVAALARMFHVTFEELLTPAEETTSCPTCGQEVPR